MVLVLSVVSPFDRHRKSAVSASAFWKQGLLHKGITSINIVLVVLGCNLHWGKLTHTNTTRGATNTEPQSREEL